MDMKFFLFKYCKVILLLIFIPVILYNILSLPCGFDKIGGKNAPEVWLDFFGGYIGALISAGVAFYILRKQNNENRVQNDSNRKLQINVLHYQQELQRLCEFRKLSVKYTSILNEQLLYNNIISISNNTAQLDSILDQVTDSVNDLNSSLRLAINNDIDSIQLYQEVKCISHKYVQILKDLRFLSIHLQNRKGSCENSYCKFIESTQISESLSDEIKLIIAHKDKDNKHKDNVFDLAYEAVKYYLKCNNGMQANVSDLFLLYIKKEEMRIEKILNNYE